jgi:hypothetical protein
MSSKLEIRLGGQIAGEPLTPATLPVADLLNLLTKFLDAVKSEARPDPIDVRSPGTIALTAIQPGSAKLVFEVGTAAPAVDRITSALAARDLSTLRPDTQVAVRSALNVVLSRGGEVQLSNGKVTPTFSQKDSLPTAQRPSVMKELTSILAFLNEVGHEKQPSARVRLYTARTPSEGDELTVKMPREVCIALSPHIFKDVTFHGEAKWAIYDRRWRLAGFEATSFTPMKGEPKTGGRPLAQVFGDIARAAPGAWDEIDPADYVHTSRLADEDNP